MEVLQFAMSYFSLGKNYRKLIANQCNNKDKINEEVRLNLVLLLVDVTTIILQVKYYNNFNFALNLIIIELY